MQYRNQIGTFNARGVRLRAPKRVMLLMKLKRMLGEEEVRVVVGGGEGEVGVHHPHHPHLHPGGVDYSAAVDDQACCG